MGRERGTKGLRGGAVDPGERRRSMRPRAAEDSPNPTPLCPLVPLSLSPSITIPAMPRPRVLLLAHRFRDDVRAMIIEIRTGIAEHAEIVADLDADSAELPSEIDADLIAMGSHGRSGLSHFFLGSVAERVVQHAPCPVLVVR